jgi:hypothetical protein
MRSEPFPDLPSTDNIHLHTCVTPDEAIPTKEIRSKGRKAACISNLRHWVTSARTAAAICWSIAETVDCKHGKALRMVCTQRGHRGADVRPDWRRMTSKRHVWRDSFAIVFADRAVRGATGNIGVALDRQRSFSDLAKPRSARRRIYNRNARPAEVPKNAVLYRPCRYVVLGRRGAIHWIGARAQLAVVPMYGRIGGPPTNKRYV